MLERCVSFRQFCKLLSAISPTVGHFGTKALLKAVPNLTISAGTDKRAQNWEKNQSYSNQQRPGSFAKILPEKRAIDSDWSSETEDLLFF